MSHQYLKLKSIISVHPEANQNIDQIVDKYKLPTRSSERIKEGDIGMLVQELEHRSVIDVNRNEYSALKIIIDSIKHDSVTLKHEFECLTGERIPDSGSMFEGRSGADSGIWMVCNNSFSHLCECLYYIFDLFICIPSANFRQTKKELCRPMPFLELKSI